MASKTREDASGRADEGEAGELTEGPGGRDSGERGPVWGDITVSINGVPLLGAEDVTWSETRQTGRPWPTSYQTSGTTTIAGHHGRNLGRIVDSLSAQPNRHQRRRAAALARRAA